MPFGWIDGVIPYLVAAHFELRLLDYDVYCNMCFVERRKVELI